MWDEWDSFEINSGLNYFNPIPIGGLKQNLPTIYISHLLPPTTCDHNSTPNKINSYGVVFQVFAQDDGEKLLIVVDGLGLVIFLVEWFFVDG